MTLDGGCGGGGEGGGGVRADPPHAHQALYAEPAEIVLVSRRSLHSSTFQLNLSNFLH